MTERERSAPREEDVPSTKVDIFNPTRATRVVYTANGRSTVTIDPGQRARNVELSDSYIEELAARNDEQENSDLICRPSGSASPKQEKEEQAHFEEETQPRRVRSQPRAKSQKPKASKKAEKDDE